MSTIKVDTVNEKSTNGNIAVIPTGSGKLVLDGLTWPHADGSAGQLLKSNGSGVLSFVDAPSAGFTQGTEQATTSGTSWTFSGIPAGVDMVVINWYGFSMSGAITDIDVQIGDAGGIEAGSYISSAMKFESDGTRDYNKSTSAFNIVQNIAADAIHGTMVLTLEDAANHAWLSTHVFENSGADAIQWGGGSKTLSGALTQLKISGGTGDAGAVNIMYQ